MAKIEVSAIKDRAAGQWPAIISRVAGISDDYLTTRHGPCPRCGGNKPWRVFPDFVETGGAICNHCGKFGDGLAVVRWSLNCSFPDALKKVADYLGLATESSATKQPSANLVEIPWNDLLVNLWCLKKQPITPAAIKAVGGRLARYRNRYTVIAIPIVASQGKTVGWTLYEIGGGMLPVFRGKGVPPEMVKVKVTTGSEAGWMGEPKGSVVWKTEGPTDLLSLMSLGLPEGHSACCNAFGAGETPKDWMLEKFTGTQAFVIHDCDQPGQDGALEVAGQGGRSRPGWAPRIADYATESRNVVLPYEIQASHGKDLRDWILEQLQKGLLRDQIYEQLLSLAEASELVEQSGRKGEDSSSGAQPSGGEAEIEISVDESIMVAATIERLSQEGNIYQRDGILVQSLIKPVTVGEGESISIREIPVAALRTIISGCCRYFREEQGERHYRSVPGLMPKQVACEGNYPGIKSLAGVTEYPILRADGTACFENGYDEKSRTIIQCTANVAEFPENPTREDAVRAAERLMDLVCDFPFSKPECRTAWLASMLTPVARTAIRGPVPLMLYDASSSGSGKSRLADVVAVALTGRPMPRTPWPTKDEEVRKSITAIIRSSQPLSCFDNVRSLLGGQSVEALGTSETWTDRILGESRNTSELLVRTVFYFTANNASLTEDAARRMCYCRIEPETDRPESRTGFKYEDLLGHILTRRGQILADVLTILMAYQQAGSPRVDSAAWGSFESWCRVVRDPLVWLGMADPRGGTFDLSSASADDCFQDLIGGLVDAGIPDEGWTTRQILDAANQTLEFGSGFVNDKLASAIQGISESKVSLRGLGKKLKKFDGRIFGGRKFSSGFDSHKNISLWRVIERSSSPSTDQSCEVCEVREVSCIPANEEEEEEEVNISTYKNTQEKEKEFSERPQTSLSSQTSQPPAKPIGISTKPPDIPKTTSQCSPSCEESCRQETIRNGWIETTCSQCGRFFGRRPVDSQMEGL